jgi:ankyrin repeat protein
MRAIARAAFISHPAAAAADFDRCWPEIRDDLLKQHTLQLLTDSAARLDELTPDIQRASALSMLRLASVQSNSKNHGLSDEHVAGGDRSLQGTYQTALLVIAAARDGSLVRLRALISAGADMNVKDSEGWTPLMVAALKGHAKTVVLLLSHGAHIETKNNSGWTALRFASSVGDTEMMTLLIGYGADVNSRDDHRQTILMQAAEDGNISSVRELLEAGADKEARNLAHESALSIALHNGHAEIVQLLKKSSSSPIKKAVN